MEKVVKFRSDYVLGDEGIVHPSFGQVKVEGEFIKQYKNTLYRVLTLPHCARILMDYLLETSGKKGVVGSTKLTRDRFNDAYEGAWKDFFISEGLEPYLAEEEAFKKRFKDNTIAHSYTHLVKRRLLIKIERGSYQINPEYFFSDSEKERLQKIKMVLEFERGTTTGQIDKAKKQQKTAE